MASRLSPKPGARLKSSRSANAATGPTVPLNFTHEPLSPRSSGPTKRGVAMSSPRRVQALQPPPQTDSTVGTKSTALRAPVVRRVICGDGYTVIEVQSFHSKRVLESPAPATQAIDAGTKASPVHTGREASSSAPGSIELMIQAPSLNEDVSLRSGVRTAWGHSGVTTTVLAAEWGRIQAQGDSMPPDVVRTGLICVF